jgi:hypothetical protein
MAERKILTQTPDDLVDDLAWALLQNAWLLPEAPRKGRVKLGLEDCRAIARRQVERLKATGVVELLRQVPGAHSWPPRDPAADKS